MTSAALTTGSRADLHCGGDLSRCHPGAAGYLFSEALTAEGALVFEAACRIGLEGIVSKRLGRPYCSGRSKDWVKTKNPDFQRR